MNEDGRLICIFPDLDGRNLNVEDMDLEIAVGNTLKRSGIHTLAQLLRLNHTELVQIFPNRKLRSYEDVIHCLVCLSEESMDIASPAFESVEDISDILGGFNMPDKKFNIFQVAGIYKSEEIHTSVIAELINPRSCFHDKGADFLDKFLQMKEIGLALSPEELKAAEVKTEVPTNKGRRMDMTISVGKYYLPFEVKIWAGDQDAQLQDYYEFAKEQAENLKKETPRIYYLTPDGHEPSKRSCGEQSDVPVQLLSFKDHILPWLDECMNEPNRPSDVLEIMNQLHDNIQGCEDIRGRYPGFSRWGVETDALDIIYQNFPSLAWTECDNSYMTFTLNKEGPLEFALRIKKEYESKLRLYLICGIEGEDGQTDYAGAGVYISENPECFQALLNATFKDNGQALKLKADPIKNVWNRLPETDDYKNLNAAQCCYKIQKIFEALMPKVRQNLEGN